MSNRRKAKATGASNPADAKAKLAAAFDRASKAWAAGDPIVAAVYRDVTVWLLGGVQVVTPTLSADAPPELHEWLECRVQADLTGRCPTCGAGATLTIGHTAIDHDTDCAVLVAPDGLDRWTTSPS